MNDVSPQLSVRRGREAVEFYKEGFGVPKPAARASRRSPIIDVNSPCAMIVAIAFARALAPEEKK
jgi:hypothetical protein